MRSSLVVVLAAGSSVCSCFSMKPIKTPGLAMPAVQLIADRCWDTFLWAADVKPLQLGKDIEIKPSRGRGDGLFALRDLERGEIVGRYAGVMRSIEDQDRLCANGKATRDYVFEVPDTNWVIDGEDKSQASVVRYVNHSIRRANCEAGRLNLQGRCWGIYCEPTLSLQRARACSHARSLPSNAFTDLPRAVAVEVNKPVAAGKELYFNYGVVYWDGVYRRVDPRRWKADFL